MQYYDVLSHNELPGDALDIKMGCVCLIWDRYSDESDRRVPGSFYALTLFESIRGRVTLRRAGEHTKLLQNIVPCKKKLIDLVVDSENWENDLFSVNRFRRDNNATSETDSATWESIEAIQNNEYSASIN